MQVRGCVEDAEVKRANIVHHDAEAEIFELQHPEGSSIYERAKASESIALIVGSSRERKLCVDVGCGTGFLTSFELPFYDVVVGVDISRKMVEVAKRRLKDSLSVHFVVCDADFLPFRSGVADLVSISSVLHHLPNPYNSLGEACRVLRNGGFVYVTREPNFQRFRRFFDFFDGVFVRNFVRLFRRIASNKNEAGDKPVNVEGLDYGFVDVHYSTGLYLAQLVNFLKSRRFSVAAAYSYHWIYSDLKGDFWDWLMTRSNFLIEKMPFSRRLGRYLCIVARKRAGSD